VLVAGELEDQDLAVGPVATAHGAAEALARKGGKDGVAGGDPAYSEPTDI
jgi:hypothetical protein